MTARVGILHPGTMGAQLGAVLVDAGHHVSWASEGRSAPTVERAARAGLTDRKTVRDLVAHCDGIISVCPPAAAPSVAGLVAEHQPHGWYCDANAVAPETAGRIAEPLIAAGVRFCDAGIVGPPPSAPGLTRLFVSGDGVEVVATCFDGTPVEVVVLDGGVGAASAVKVAYAAWTKGSAAMLLAIRAFARHHDVEEPLLAEWDRSQPGLDRRSAAAAGVAAKAWRFVGEMNEIADALGAASLPSEFHRGAAELYSALRWAKDRDGVSLDEVLDALSSAGGRTTGEVRP